MNRAQALARVANWVAGNLEGGTFEEGTGLSAAEITALSNSDERRLAWAIDEVGRRLRKMGKQDA